MGIEGFASSEIRHIGRKPASHRIAEARVRWERRRALRPRTAGGRTVFALVDPARPEWSVLGLAAEVALAARRDLVILVLGDEAAAVRAAEGSTCDLAARGVRVRVRAFERDRLLDVLRGERGGILVSSPETLAIVDEVGAATLDVERWACSLLLVRTTD